MEKHVESKYFFTKFGHFYFLLYIATFFRLLLDQIAYPKLGGPPPPLLFCSTVGGVLSDYYISVISLVMHHAPSIICSTLLPIT